MSNQEVVVQVLPLDHVRYVDGVRIKRDESAHVKVFGSWPLTNDATWTSGWLRKTSKGGSRGRWGAAVRALWGFE